MTSGSNIGSPNLLLAPGAISLRYAPGYTTWQLQLWLLGFASSLTRIVKKIRLPDGQYLIGLAGILLLI